jgi:hypothetical protein
MPMRRVISLVVLARLTIVFHPSVLTQADQLLSDRQCLAVRC